MHKLAIEFLSKDKENKSIYEKVIATHDRYYTNILVERFYYYMFKIYFISYIEKSIRLKSLEIKNKKKKSYERELYILNSIDEELNISKQSVNKVKLAALKNIRKHIGGEINGRNFY